MHVIYKQKQLYTFLRINTSGATISNLGKVIIPRYNIIFVKMLPIITARVTILIIFLKLAIQMKS
jgi:hypothetical protein